MNPIVLPLVLVILLGGGCGNTGCGNTGGCNNGCDTTTLALCLCILCGCNNNNNTCPGTNTI